MASIAKAPPVLKRSSSDPGLRAANAAKGIDSANAITCDRTSNSKVTGSRWPSIVETSSFVVDEVPRSPCTTFPR
ncbi:MAG: hypothetical protein ACK5MR_14090 [Cumulibacter sp.]